MTVPIRYAPALVGALFIASVGCGESSERPAPAPEPEPAATAEEPAPEVEDEGDEIDDEIDEDEGAPAIDDETVGALEALGYFPSARTDNPEARGVTVGPPEGATGLNLYSSRYRASAALIDMSGREIHRWEPPPGDEDPKPWMHVEPLEGGDLLVITKSHHVSRLTWGSELVWRTEIPAHHDLAVHPDGRIFALVRWGDRLRFEGESLPVLADGVAILSSEGELQRRVELIPLLRDEISTARLRRIRARVEQDGPGGIVRGGGLGDVTHVNSIEVLPRDIEGVAPAGSFLLSFRAIDRVVILDPTLSRVLWRSPEGLTDGQHDATILDDDRFLIFDNRWRAQRSRVIELDPRTGEVGWQYDAEGFFSLLRGGAQRLANGNTVITESDTGRAFEVTREGEVVWEFHNPNVRGSGEEAEREVIYRLDRFEPAFFGEHD